MADLLPPVGEEFEIDFPLSPGRRWTREAAESLAGQVVPFKVGDAVVATARVVEAECLDGGARMRCRWERES